MVVWYHHTVRVLIVWTISHFLVISVAPCSPPTINCFLITNLQLSVNTAQGGSADVPIGNQVTFHLDMNLDVGGTSANSVGVPSHVSIDGYLSTDTAGSNPLPVGKVSATVVPETLLQFTTSTNSFSITNVEFTIDLTSHTNCDFTHICLDFNPAPSTSWQVDTSSSNTGCMTINCIAPSTSVGPTTQSQVISTRGHTTTLTYTNAPNPSPTGNTVALMVEEFSFTYNLTVNSDFLSAWLTFSMYIYPRTSATIQGNTNWDIDVFISRDEAGSTVWVSRSLQLTEQQLAEDLNTGETLTFGGIHVGIPINDTYCEVTFIYVCIRVEPHENAQWILDTQYSKNVQCQPIECPSSKGPAARASCYVLMALYMAVYILTTTHT